MRTATTFQEDVAAEWSEPARDEPAEQAAPSAEDLDSVEVEATSSSNSNAEPLVGDLDVLGRFYADLAKTPLLDREAERALTTEISKARDSVVSWLRRHPRIVNVTLTERGRGVIRPTEEFREREILLVAQRAGGLGRRRARVGETHLQCDGVGQISCEL